MKMLRVEWEDSAAPREGTWHDDDVDMGIVNCVSVGFEVRRTKKMLLLAMGHDDNDPPRWHSIWAIPRRAIVRGRRLK